MEIGKDIASLNLSLELHKLGFKGEEFISIARQNDLNNYIYPNPKHTLEPNEEYICPADGVSLMANLLPQKINYGGKEYKLDQSATMSRWHIGYKEDQGTEYVFKETGSIADSIASLLLSLYSVGLVSSN